MDCAGQLHAQTNCIKISHLAFFTFLQRVWERDGVQHPNNAGNAHQEVNGKHNILAAGRDKPILMVSHALTKEINTFTNIVSSSAAE